MQKISRKFKTGASAVAVLVVLFGVYGLRKLQALAADPTGEKDCRPAAAGEQGKIDLERIKAVAPLQGVKWSQLGGSINDASCLNKTEIYGVVEVHSVDDIEKTLKFARDNADFGSGFIAMTSRCSFELVQKAATMRVPLLATLSAPTALALELAGRAGMMLAARSPDGIVFFGSDGEGRDGSA